MSQGPAVVTERQLFGAHEARPGNGRIGKTRGRHSVANPARKKAQNRVAQRSFREKQTAYVQYLESFVETVQAERRASGNNVDTHENKLLQAHLDLLDGYRQLYDAFLRLRQKLRSLGQSATAAAGEWASGNYCLGIASLSGLTRESLTR